MPNYHPVQSGNWNNPFTWGLVTGIFGDIDGVGTDTPITTTPTTGITFTMGGVTTSALGIAIRPSCNTFSGGGIGVFLRPIDGSVWSTGGNTIISGAALPHASTTSAFNHGWLVAKFGPVPLIAGKSYTIALSGTSRNGTFRANTVAGINNGWASFIVTTGFNLVPASGDRVFIGGFCSGVAAQTGSAPLTVLYDYTGSPRRYSNIDISAYGELAFDNQPSCTYFLSTTGHIRVWASGSLTVASEDSPLIPQATGIIEFAPRALDGNAGLHLHIGSKFHAFGMSGTTWTFLTQSAASGGRVFDVVNTNGWVAGDRVVLATTSTLGQHTKEGIVSGVLSNTQFAFTGNIVNNPAGFNIGTIGGLMSGEIANLSSNLIIRGQASGARYSSFIGMSGCNYVSLKDVEMYWLGGPNALRRGIDYVQGASPLDNAYYHFRQCSFHDFANTSSLGFNTSVQAGTNTNSGLVITDSVYYNINNTIITLARPRASIRRNLFFSSMSSVGETTITSNNCNFSECRWIGAKAGADVATIAHLDINSTGLAMLFNDCVSKAGLGVAIQIRGVGAFVYPQYIDNLASLSGCFLFGNAYNLGFGVAAAATIPGRINLIGCNIASGRAANVVLWGCRDAILDKCIISGGPAIVVGNTTTQYGGRNLAIKNSTIVAPNLFSAYSTSVAKHGQIRLNNCAMNIVSYTGITSINRISETFSILGTNINTHKGFFTFNRYGVIDADFINFNGEGPSMKMSPYSNLYLYSPNLNIPVASGTSVSGSFDVLFTGHRPGLLPLELYQAKNTSLGVDSGVIGTYLGPSGTWQTFTFQTSAVNYNGILALQFRMYNSGHQINIDNFRYIAYGIDSRDLSVPLGGAPFLVKSI